MDGWAYLEDRIRNEDIRNGFGVANIEEKMKENRLRWFRNVQIRGISKQEDRKLEVMRLKKRERKIKDDLEGISGKG